MLGAGITSFFGDLSYEAVIVLLPSFLLLLNAPLYALGIIEGASDGVSSFLKLLSGYFSDKFMRKKEFATLGYVGTAVFPAIVAVATSWPIVLFGKILGWMGKGLRGPPRDAIIASSVDKKYLGRAFGFHRAGDTLGAILGPLFALSFVASLGLRSVFWISVIPGTLAVISFWILIKREKYKKVPEKRTLVGSLKDLPLQFKKFTLAVGTFGIADFSHVLLIAFAVGTLSHSFGMVKATAIGIILYTIRNITYALSSYPFGFLGDKFGRRNVLIIGYLIAVFTFFGFAFTPHSFYLYIILFALAGIFIGAEDTLEGAVTGGMIGDKRKGTAFGVIASVNGIGDFVSSVVVGFLWTFVGFASGFLFSGALSAIATLLLAITGKKKNKYK